MPKVIASVSGMRQRQQQRRAPLPEADQRDEDDEHDRLVEAAHEEVDVLLDLQRLVGGAARMRSGGSLVLQSASVESTARPKAPICSPGRIWSDRRDRPASVPVARRNRVQE